jgi:hypothetical protein
MLAAVSTIFSGPMTRPILLILVATLGCGSGGGSTGADSAPAQIEIFPGQNFGAIHLGARIKVPIQLSTIGGKALEMPAGLQFISRKPTEISVDSSTWVTARTLGQGAWLVATLAHQGKQFTDSVHLEVVCTAEGEQVNFVPPAIETTVGQSAPASVVITSCSGQMQHTDTITWTILNTNIATVDAAGNVRGLAVGTTALSARGAVRGSLGAIPVTVR